MYTLFSRKAYTRSTPYRGKILPFVQDDRCGAFCLISPFLSSACPMYTDKSFCPAFFKKLACPPRRPPSPRSSYPRTPFPAPPFPSSSITKSAQCCCRIYLNLLRNLPKSVALSSCNCCRKTPVRPCAARVCGGCIFSLSSLNSFRIYTYTARRRGFPGGGVFDRGFLTEPGTGAPGTGEPGAVHRVPENRGAPRRCRSLHRRSNTYPAYPAHHRWCTHEPPRTKYSAHHRVCLNPLHAGHRIGLPRTVAPPATRLQKQTQSRKTAPKPASARDPASA